MVNKISEKITDILNKKNIVSDKKYSYIDMIIQQIISIICILLFTICFGIFYNYLLEVIIIIIVLNIMRWFSGGIHFNINFCTIFSIIYIIFLSWISKNTYQYSFNIFLIIVAITILSITIIPKLSQEDKEHTDKYYRNGFIYIYVSIYLIQITCAYLNYLQILNAINFGIISVLLMLTNLKKG
jgi:accessory gene regulator protein AgrB